MKPSNEDGHRRRINHRKNLITKNRGVETNLHESSTSETTKPDLPNKQSRYKWINAPATSLPTTTKSDLSTSGSSKSKSGIQSEHIKDEAVLFIKEKLSKRKVHVNKHHASFKNKTFSAINSHGSEEKDKALNCDRTGNRKQAAMDFLKQAGVISNRVDDEAIFEPSLLTKRNKTEELKRQNFKVDRRPKKSTFIIQKSKELTSRLSPAAMPGQRKLLMEKSSTCPQYRHLNREEIKSEAFGLQQKQSRFKFVRSVSDQSSSRNGSSKVNCYKVVRSRTTPTRQIYLSKGANAQNNLTSFSKYKLVKSVKPVEVEQKSVLSSGVCNTKSATAKGKRIPTKSKYKWTKDDFVNNRKPRSSVESIKLRTFSQDSYSTTQPQSIKKKTRFKLVRKTHKPTPVQSPAVVKAVGSSKCMKNSRYKSIYKRNREVGKGESLVWKNRFSLKRNNNAGMAIRFLCVFGEPQPGILDTPKVSLGYFSRQYRYL